MFRSPAVLKHILRKIIEFLSKARKEKLFDEDSQFYNVRYLSVPLWKPWRDF